MSSENVAIQAFEVLECAADYLATYGWSQREYGWDSDVGEPRPSCIIGAIRAAHVGCSIRGVGAASLRDIVEQSLDIADYTLERWNDAPARTADEVILALLETAARLREGGV
jgi:hypothetical protein